MSLLRYYISHPTNQDDRALPEDEWATRRFLKMTHTGNCSAHRALLISFTNEVTV